MGFVDSLELERYKRDSFKIRRRLGTPLAHLDGKWGIFDHLTGRSYESGDSADKFGGA